MEDSVLQTFHSVLECCNEATKKPATPNATYASDFDPTPIWILPFIFERLILAPNPTTHLPKNQRISINKLIHERLRLFKSGQIRKLYEESNKIRSKTPQENADNPVDINKAAQLAADLNNLGSANARLTKDTPVALIDDDNIDVCYALHPPSLNLDIDYSPGIRTRSASTNQKRVEIHPATIISIISNLNRGKAPGNNIDSLDIYIKLVASYKRTLKKGDSPPFKRETLSTFFTTVANGDVTPRITKLLRTTYMVALRKSTTDPKKLRPLGIPSAIRRITAAAILHMYRGRFAEALLPFNYAFGVSGGVDFVASTMRLGIEKYINDAEKYNGLPTRSLVSLDIKNMFNAVSRQKLRQILAIEFPELAPFADCLYKEQGQTVIKRKNGTWEWIPVREGFSQGCPMSPVFAGFVLKRILTQVFKDMKSIAIARHKKGEGGDDGQGGVPLIMGFVDDVNALVPTNDVFLFLQLFEKYGNPLGAILNTDKTRILTTTSGKSVVQRLINSDLEVERQAGTSLSKAIHNYSRNKGEPIEVTDGLRVLGVPIGSAAFAVIPSCEKF